MRCNKHKCNATLTFNNQQLFFKPVERAWCISGHAQIMIVKTMPYM